MKRACFPYVFAVAFVSIVAPPTAALGDTDQPTVSVGRERIAPGDQVQVRGVRWPPGDLVAIELCGNDALDASVDCDVQNSTSFAVRDSTEFFGLLTAQLPPKPCPCVVRVTSQNVADAITVPVDFPSAGFVPAEGQAVEADISRLLEISTLEVRDTSSWGTWFGAPAERVADVRVTNTGDVPIRDATLTITTGRGSDPTDIVSSRDIGVLEVGESVRLSVPYEFDALSFGRYTTRASIGGLGTDVVARATTSTYPWALIALAVVALQSVLLLIRNAVRRRIAAAVEEEESEWYEARVLAGPALGELPVPAVVAHESADSGEHPRRQAADVVAVDESGEQLHGDVRAHVLGPGVLVIEEFPRTEDPGEEATDRLVATSSGLRSRLRRETAIAVMGQHEEAEVLAARLREDAQRREDEIRHVVDEERAALIDSVRAVEELASALVATADRRTEAVVAEVEHLHRQVAGKLEGVKAQVQSFHSELEELRSELRARLEEFDRSAYDQAAAIRVRAEAAFAEIVRRAAEEEKVPRKRAQETAVSIVTGTDEEMAAHVFAGRNDDPSGDGPAPIGETGLPSEEATADATGQRANT